MMFLTFISEYFVPYIWMLGTTLINIIAPISGSSIVTPVLAFFTDPQRAVGILAYTLFFTGMHRVYLFRKETFSDEKNIALLKTLLPFSLLGAFAGGMVIAYLDKRILAGIVIASSLFFFVHAIRSLVHEETGKKKSPPLARSLIFLLTGFLQGAGMPGSDMRNNYLRTVISEVSLRGVTSFVGMCNFFISGSVLLFRNHLTFYDGIFLAITIPCLFPIQFYGKKLLTRMSDRHAKMLAIALSFVGIVLLTKKYFL